MKNYSQSESIDISKKIAIILAGKVTDFNAANNSKKVSIDTLKSVFMNASKTWINDAAACLASVDEYLRLRCGFIGKVSHYQEINNPKCFGITIQPCQASINKAEQELAAQNISRYLNIHDLYIEPQNTRKIMDFIE